MKKRCCIYCRVLDKEGIKLLDYQEQILTKFAKEKDFNVFYTFFEIGNGTDFRTAKLQQLIHFVRRKDIDVVLTYSKNRISVYEDLAEEFEMICNKHNVQLLTY